MSYDNQGFGNTQQGSDGQNFDQQRLQGSGQSQQFDHNNARSNFDSNTGTEGGFQQPEQGAQYDPADAGSAGFGGQYGSGNVDSGAFDQGSRAKYTDKQQNPFGDQGGQPGINQGSGGQYTAGNQGSFGAGADRISTDTPASGLDQGSGGQYASGRSGDLGRSQDNWNKSGVSGGMGSQSQAWSSQGTPGGRMGTTGNTFDDTGLTGTDKSGSTGGMAGNASDNYDSSYGQDQTSTKPSHFGSQTGQTGTTGSTAGGQTSDWNDSTGDSGTRGDDTGDKTGTMGSHFGNQTGGQNNQWDDSTGGTGPKNDQAGGESKREQQSGKPTMEDKLKGTAEKLAGSLTRNQGLKERGQERKTGEMGSTTSGY